MYIILILISVNYCSAGLQPRIVNGEPASNGQVGYIVAIHWRTYHKCSGSIIDENNVLTAAHCVEKIVSSYSIQYGVLKIKPNNINLKAVKEKLIHNDYNPITLVGDIAVLKFFSPIPLNSVNVRPIPLPSQGEEFGAYSSAFAAGWGTLDKIYGNSSDHLQTVTLTVLTVEECKRAYTTYFREQYEICVGDISGARRGLCIRDSGSPLVIAEKLAGVYSWALDVNDSCGYRRTPDVCVKVSQYVNWIEEQVQEV